MSFREDFCRDKELSIATVMIATGTCCNGLSLIAVVLCQHSEMTWHFIVYFFLPSYTVSWSVQGDLQQRKKALAYFASPQFREKKNLNIFFLFLTLPSSHVLFKFKI